MKQKWKRILAVILSLSLLVGMFAVVAQAATAKVYLTGIPRSTDKVQSGWKTPSLTLRNGWQTHPVNPTGKALNSQSGTAVYCLEISAPLKSGESRTRYGSDYLYNHLPWNGALDANGQQKLLSYVLYYGYKGNVHPKTWVTQNSTGSKELAWDYATQLLVWEVVVGERDIDFNHLSKAQTGAKNEVIEYMRSNCPLRSTILSYYNTMVANIQKALKVPSFMSKAVSGAYTYELNYRTDQKVYEVSLTDTNNVLGNYNFSGTGLSFTVNGNVLTVRSDHPISDGVTITATKKNSNTVCGTVVWGDGKIDVGGSGKQDVLAHGAEVKDPLQAYVNVKAEPATGNIQISKTSEDGKTAFSFRVTGENYDQTFSTAESTTGTGVVTVSDLLPGTYTISEVNPGNRYTVLSSKNITVKAGENYTASFSNTLKEQYNISVVKKDSETGEKLKGATFEAFADTNGNGQYDAGTDKSLGTFKDNGDGTYTIKNLKYSDNIFVKETKAPENYQLNTEVFRIPVDETILNYSLECKNLHDKGIVRVVKQDAETKEALSGAEFTLYADTNGNGKYDAGTDKAVQTLTETAEKGTYESTKVNTGLYFVKETKAPATFRQDTNVYKANVASNGYICYISNLATEAEDGTSIFINQPMKGQITLTKVDSETKQVVKGATFEVFQDSNGNGQYDAGTDKSMGNMTESAGGVFIMKNLRMGTYFVKETEAPYGYSLDGTICTVKLEEDHKTYSASNDTEGEGATWAWINAPIHIGTTAKDSETGDHLAYADADVTLVDTVEYVNLMPNTEYTLVGTLMDKETGKAIQVDGKDVTASTTFTTPTGKDKYATGTADVTFRFDGSALAGKTVVVYEDLYLNGKKVADHSNIGDDKQTVYFPEIHTSLLDKETSDKLSCADEDVTLVDTVSYSNLIAGKEYTVTGTLMDKETGEAIQVAGKDVTASAKFTPKEANGTVDVTFRFDGSALAGKTAVAFETLSYNGKELAVHADINDEEQTVYFPEIHTTAVDSETGIHLSDANASATLIDTVSYSNLIAGKEYTVIGTLMNKETGEAIQVAGQDVTASAKFKAAETTGTVDVIFNFDASALAGKTTVVFEDLYLEGQKVAVHADVNDEEQTIHFPKIHTTAVDSDTGIHNSYADEEITVIDSVQYENLIPGKEYTVTGTLMDKDTGEALMVNGEEVTSSTTFTAAEAAGSVDVTFTFDGSALAGKTLVAFETLTYTGKEVAVHTDITDEEQTIWVPGGHTTAVDSETGIQNSFVDDDVTIIDTITYTGLIPGKEYVATGTLMDKETGEPLTVNGEEVTSSTTFTPEAKDGTVDVTFNFDGSALAGKAVVAFETVTYEGKTVFTHTDLEDNEQTVYFPNGYTTAFDGQSGTQMVDNGKEATVVDVVTYTNLVPGKEYTVTGTLMDKETGEPLTVNGKPVTAFTTFVPVEANGDIMVTFKFDASALAGKTAVAFETVTHNGKEVFTHADLNDQQQTVYFPKLKTTATDAEDGDKTIAYNGTVTILDHVEYENLVPNTEYKLVGTLMNKKTGKAVQVNGKDVTATVTFVPETASGSVDVELTFDVTGLDAGEYVVFEKLYDAASDKLVGHHEDINDEGQTVTIPKAPTPRTGDDNTKAIALGGVGAATLGGIFFTLYKKRKEKLAD